MQMTLMAYYFNCNSGSTWAKFIKICKSVQKEKEVLGKNETNVV